MDQIDKKKKYSVKEAAELLNVDTSMIRIWRDMGVYNSEKTDVLRLKVKDNGIIQGNDLINFIKNINWKIVEASLRHLRSQVDYLYNFPCGKRKWTRSIKRKNTPRKKRLSFLMLILQ